VGVVDDPLTGACEANAERQELRIVEVIEVGVECAGEPVGRDRPAQHAFEPAARRRAQPDQRDAFHRSPLGIGCDQGDVVARRAERHALLVEDAMVIDGMDRRDVADPPHRLAMELSGAGSRLHLT
jgi:hypothetical protein